MIDITETKAYTDFGYWHFKHDMHLSRRPVTAMAGPCLLHLRYFLDIGSAFFCYASLIQTVFELKRIFPERPSDQVVSARAPAARNAKQRIVIPATKFKAESRALCTCNVTELDSHTYLKIDRRCIFLHRMQKNV